LAALAALLATLVVMVQVMGHMLLAVAVDGVPLVVTQVGIIPAQAAARPLMIAA